MKFTRSVWDSLVGLPSSSLPRALVRGGSALAIFLLFGASLCFGQGTYTAASCSRSDVNAVINGPTHTAVNGDVIVIPTTGSPCTWTSGITINGVGIDITGTGTPNTGGGTFGSGTPNTTLIDNAGAPYFTFTGLIYGETAKVELLTMDAAGATGTWTSTVSFTGTCTTSGCPNVRVDNINYTANTWASVIPNGAFVLVDDVFGVVDHVTANESNLNTTASAGPPLVDVSYGSWQGVGTYGDNSFATADTFGTNQTFYIENNYTTAIRTTDNDVAPVGAQDGGARVVCRFNDIAAMNLSSGVCGFHATAWGGRFRGQRQVENYYNTVDCPTTSSCNLAFSVESGTGLIFANTFACQGGGTGCAFNYSSEVNIPRANGEGQSPWNNCDGTQPWDQAPYTTSSPYSQCLDQAGTGQGLLLENATPVLASNPSCSGAGACPPNAARDPVYEAGDTGRFNSAMHVASSRLVANLDYYDEVSQTAQTSATSPFNGTSGTGYGTLANRPTSCTAGVGYWATDQGSWNSYNSSQEGELFVCTSANTWTMKYEPYTYPHPLTTGGGSLGSGDDPPNPPTDLTAAVE